MVAQVVFDRLVFDRAVENSGELSMDAKFLSYLGSTARFPTNRPYNSSEVANKDNSKGRLDSLSSITLYPRSC